MISYQCKCGMVFAVDDSYKGQEVLCPRCGERVSMNNLKRASKQAGEDVGVWRTRRWTGVFWGAVLLATLAIPWTVADGWTGNLVEQIRQDPLNEAYRPLYTAAVAGILVLAFGLFLPRTPLALAYLVIGGAAAAGFVYYLGGLLTLWPPDAALDERTLALLMLNVGLPLMLAGTMFRTRIGQNTFAGVLQLLLAAGALAWLVYGIIETVPEFRAALKSSQDAIAAAGSSTQPADALDTPAFRMFLVELGGLVQFGVLALAALLSLLHGILLKKKLRGLGLLALTLGWLAIFLGGLYTYGARTIALDVFVEGAAFGEAVAMRARSLLFFVAAFAIVVITCEGLSALPAMLIARKRKKARNG